MTIIKTRLIRIGNSGGLRLPDVVIKELDLTEDVQIEVADGQFIVRSAARSRAGWESAFQAFAEPGDDDLLDPVTPTTWDATEWEW